MQEYKFLVHFLNAKTHMFKFLYSLLVYYELFFMKNIFNYCIKEWRGLAGNII